MRLPLLRRRLGRQLRMLEKRLHLKSASPEQPIASLTTFPYVMRAGTVNASMWHVYDSNTSQSPTASHRRGLAACGGDLKARASVWSKTPRISCAVPRCLARSAHKRSALTIRHCCPWQEAAGAGGNSAARTESTPPSAHSEAREQSHARARTSTRAHTDDAHPRARGCPWMLNNATEETCSPDTNKNNNANKACSSDI